VTPSHASSLSLRTMVDIQTAFIAAFFSLLRACSAQFSCEKDSEGKWVRGYPSSENSLSGSKIDAALRHGFNPSKVEYPDVLVVEGAVDLHDALLLNLAVEGAADLGDGHYINLTTARAPRPFLDSMGWGNESCKLDYSSATAFWGLGANLRIDDNIFHAAKDYLAGFVTNDDGQFSLDALRNLSDIISLSTPNWNKTYFNNVFPVLAEEARMGSGCVNPTSATFGSRTVLNGDGRSPFDGRSSFMPCWSFTSDFVVAYKALPLSLGDASAYIDFCESFGWYFPYQFKFGYKDTSIMVNGEEGNKTTYLFGNSGRARPLEMSEEECKDPEPLSFELRGWHDVYMEGDYAQIRQNFEEFYRTYPLTGQPSPSVEVLMDQQLFTFDNPLTRACDYWPPSMPPSDGHKYAGAATSQYTGAATSLFLGTFALRYWVWG